MMTPHSNFTQEALSLKRWMTDHALPFWAKTAVDAQGGFFEDLDLDGAPRLDAVRRVRVQARQVFVYAGATHLGWYDGADIADRCFDFMCRYGQNRDGQGGFVHLINSDYSVNNARRDLYDHAFYLLSCASLMGCKTSARRDAARVLCDELLDFIDLNMGACKGWTEGVPATLPRRQNPHMHLFETCMALYDATGERRFMDRADSIFTLFEQYFFDPKHHIIREFFDNDWGYADGPIGETAEPGHGCEWVWLLGQYEARSDVDCSDYRRALYDRAITDMGFLNDEEDIDGNIRRSTKRLWVQTELIRAHLTMMDFGDGSAAQDAAQRATMAMADFARVYLKPDGTWHDQIDAEKAVISTTIPTSSFYHIYGMITEAARLAKI